MTPKKQWALIALAIAAALIGARSCDSNTPDQGNADNLTPEVRAQIEAEARRDAAEAEPKEETAAVPAARKGDAIRAMIEDGAVEDITPDEYPDIYRRLGSKTAKDVKNGAWAAAYRVAHAASCDKIYAASVTPDITKHNQKFFVNCYNGNQWTFTAAQLKDKRGKWFTIDNAPGVGASDTEKYKAAHP
ncbi:hypothetical protein ACH54D_20520 [Atlantibacter hermannii]|uniref:hypothetical protein n=1 Tax=Atlantibacter hermannii TaxID=565 RepID=UPI0032513385